MKYLFSDLIVFFQFLVCCGIFACTEKKRNFFLPRVILSVAGAVGVVTVINLFEFGGEFNFVIKFFIIFALLMAIEAVCFKVDIKDIAFDCSGGYALEHAVYCLVTIIMYFFPNTFAFAKELWQKYLFIHLPVTIPTALLVYYTLIRPMAKKGLLSEKNLSCVFLSVIILFCAVVLNELSRIGMGHEINRFTTRVVCKAYSFICCVLVIFLQLVVFTWKKTEKDKELIEYMFEQKKTQYKYSRDAIDLINTKYHDLKHQINALRSMEQGDREKVLSNIENGIRVYDGIIKTGNESLDVVLSEYSLRCLEHKIKFSYSAKAELLDGIESVDIYSLFGNALDNAVKCLSEEPEEKRILSVTVSPRNKMVYIGIENYCSGKVEFKNGLPVTKQDTRYHGYGTKSIEVIVKKYGGNLRMSVDNDTFTVGIVFPQLNIKTSKNG